MKNKTLTYRICLLFLFLSYTAVGFALKVPPIPKNRVNDYANILSAKETSNLERKLKNFEDTTSNQVAVVILPSLEGENLEDFSMRLAEQWKIGQKGKDNGVILLAFIKDRKIRLEVGYGLEGALPDAICNSIIFNEMRPRFRNNLFYGGIDVATDSIILATKGEYKAKKVTTRRKRRYSPFSFIFFLIFIGFAIVANVVSPRKRRTGLGRRSSGYYHSGWGSGFGGGGFGGGGFSGGGGSFGGGGSSGGW
jgi:uncharacterized protein